MSHLRLAHNFKSLRWTFAVKGTKELIISYGSAQIVIWWNQNLEVCFFSVSTSRPSWRHQDKNAAILDLNVARNLGIRVVPWDKTADAFWQSAGAKTLFDVKEAFCFEKEKVKSFLEPFGCHPRLEFWHLSSWEHCTFSWVTESLVLIAISLICSSNCKWVRMRERTVHYQSGELKLRSLVRRKR